MVLHGLVCVIFLNMKGILLYTCGIIFSLNLGTQNYLFSLLNLSLSIGAMKISQDAYEGILGLFKEIEYLKAENHYARQLRIGFSDWY